MAQEHLLVTGLPGTAKSAVVRRVAQSPAAVYLNTCWAATPSRPRSFGTVDLRKLREGTVETDTTGMLPQADAFLDEVFLLDGHPQFPVGVLDRAALPGYTSTRLARSVRVGVVNALPADEVAVGIRRPLHAAPVRSSRCSWSAGSHAGRRLAVEQPAAAAPIGSTPLDTRDAHWPGGHDGARPALANAIRSLRQSALHCPDRRIVGACNGAGGAAAAPRSGRLHAALVDRPLLYMLPTMETQEFTARRCARLAGGVRQSQSVQRRRRSHAANRASRASRLIEASRATLRSRYQRRRSVEWKRCSGNRREFLAR